MAIAELVELQTTALWPQGDIRDPLGVWGARHGVTGDASGGEIKVAVVAAGPERAAYVYTAYGAGINQLTGVITSVSIMCRLLTNWPNIDPAAGVQGYSQNNRGVLGGVSAFTAPNAAAESGQPMVLDKDRFILLFDPRSGQNQQDITIMELKLGFNTDLATYSFEAYGYFWDRSVLQAPGGLRHPGSN